MIEAHRIGTPPAERSAANRSTDAGACPDVLLIPDAAKLDIRGTEGMRSGRVYGVIGTRATWKEVEQIEFPEGASLAPHEGLVFIPEEVLMRAAEALLAQRASGGAV